MDQEGEKLANIKENKFTIVKKDHKEFFEFLKKDYHFKKILEGCIANKIEISADNELIKDLMKAQIDLSDKINNENLKPIVNNQLQNQQKTGIAL